MENDYIVPDLNKPKKAKTNTLQQTWSLESQVSHGKLRVEKHRTHLALLRLYNFCSQFNLAMFHFLFFLINISLYKTDNQKRQHHLPQFRKENGLYSKRIVLRNKLKWKVRLGRKCLHGADNVYMEDVIRDFSPRLGPLFDDQKPSTTNVFWFYSLKHLWQSRPLTNPSSTWKKLCAAFRQTILRTKVTRTDLAVSL